MSEKKQSLIFDLGGICVDTQSFFVNKKKYYASISIEFNFSNSTFFQNNNLAL